MTGFDKLAELCLLKDWPPAYREVPRHMVEDWIKQLARTYIPQQILLAKLNRDINVAQKKDLKPSLDGAESPQEFKEACVKYETQRALLIDKLSETLEADVPFIKIGV